MDAPLQYDLLISKKKCRCGGQLFYDGRFYVCTNCHRLYCASCFGYVVASGGCFNCVNCGWSICG